MTANSNADAPDLTKHEGATACRAVVGRHDSLRGRRTFYAWCPECGWSGRKFRDEGYARTAAEKHDGLSGVSR